ncbi:MAG TPA: pyruvate kinase [Longimicrobiales bacterium]|nr:pyruvate kinase [Longimicrobiales bacterium]
MSAQDRALAPEVLDRLALDVSELREQLLAAEVQLADLLDAVHPHNQASARNLVHYLTLRRYDVRGLQRRLARAGMSSLGRSESHVLVTINRIIGMLALARGTAQPDMAAPPVEYRQGERRLAANARNLLGRHPKHRVVRIMVTLPTEAAEDRRMVHNLIAAGMDCARINCARDDAAVWSGMAENVRAATRAHGRECRILVDLGGPKARTGSIAGGRARVVLSVGDRLELVNEAPELRKRDDALPRIACTIPEIVQAIRVGEPIYFDDGNIGGIIEERTADGAIVRVTRARPGGTKLRSQRGINVPETSIGLPAISAKDLQDLETVIPFADLIGLSFAQQTEDVLALHAALNKHQADHVGVILKIETRRGFEHLPQLLLTAMQRRSAGIMIARGDLAVEVGFERMAELQEEMLWIGEAAHTPTIWATMVLDTLAKEGALSRAEMTDAAMSARAEAVMLNKGPYIVEAIHTLDDILRRMKEHQSKKRPLLRALHVSDNLLR